MEFETSCCFTGHRPNKLPWGDNERDARCLRTLTHLNVALDLAYQNGYRHFLCGMAQGGDLYFAEAVLALRNERSDITLEAVRPCPTQADRWDETQKARYHAILAQCDFETMVQHHYDRGCMLRRNRYMVDRANLVLALYDGIPKGGTAQTILYAAQQKRQIQLLPWEE